MEQKDPKDMTASELLRWAAGCNECSNCKLCCAVFGDKSRCSEHDSCLDCLSLVADKIDAELTDARADGISEGVEASLRHGAELWAKANGWPDFREGEDFGAWLDRCTLPRPRFEDGEPVQFGDEAIVRDDLGDVYKMVFGENGCDEVVIGFEYDSSATHYMCVDGNLVKRPAHEVLLGDGDPVSKGDTVYVIESGIERTVECFGTKPCGGMDGWDGSPWVMFDNGSWMHARDLTHEKPVLGADGKPIKVGETVWDVESGIEGVVDNFQCIYGQSVTANIKCPDDGEFYNFNVDRLIHTPPDTQKRIDEDASKVVIDYWGCRGVVCRDCPATIDGMTPGERYGHGSNCMLAMKFDLLRRQRELDKRTGGAE